MFADIAGTIDFVHDKLVTLNNWERCSEFIPDKFMDYLVWLTEFWLFSYNMYEDRDVFLRLEILKNIRTCMYSSEQNIFYKKYNELTFSNDK